MSFVHEPKRRKVFRVGASYVIAAWLLVQVADTVFPHPGVPDAWTTALIIVPAIGSPAAPDFARGFVKAGLAWPSVRRIDDPAKAW